MNAERDPRINPQAGDGLKYSGWYRLVQHNHEGRVAYAARCGNQWLNSVQKCTVEEWRVWAKDAEVIR